MRSFEPQVCCNERHIRSVPMIVAMVLGALLLIPTQTVATLIGINVEVFKNGVSQGTAIPYHNATVNTPLIVTASTGDTLRFVVQYSVDQVSQAEGGTYSTSLQNLDADNSAGGSREMRFVAGSAVELTGSGFAGGAGTPVTTLNDTTPTSGSANSTATAGAVQVNLYQVDYIVQTVVTDANRDFNVVLVAHSSSPPGNLVDSQFDTASVRIDAAAAIPEPASLMLLASGLAGLGLAGLRHGRRYSRGSA